jgi:Co/Zn/Cd efflux system component
MSDCCGCETQADPQRQSRVLAAVLGINLVMFFVEAGAGLFAGSAALLADSLDMLGDALVYAFSLYVVARSDRWKAGSALLKGLIQLGFGVAVLLMTAYKVLHPAVPLAAAISGVGLLALGANAVCAVLLLRHRHDDLNMNSVWLCSRNDLVSNAAVIAAGGMVALTNAQWPDIVVGAAIALLFLNTSYGVISRSAQGLRQAA